MFKIGFVLGLVLMGIILYLALFTHPLESMRADIKKQVLNHLPAEAIEVLPVADVIVTYEVGDKCFFALLPLVSNPNVLYQEIHCDFYKKVKNKNEPPQ